MKKNVCLKSALRQPIQTLGLVFLVGAISFAFVSKVVEHLVVNRETDRLAGYYRSIGSLERVAADDGNVSQAVALVSKSQHVAMEDRRRHCSGALQGIYNPDVDGNFADTFVRSDVLFCGEFVSKALLSKRTNWVAEYQFRFAVDKVLVGYPEYVQEGREVRLGYLADPMSLGLRHVPAYPDELKTVYDSFEIGRRYLVRARFDPDYQRFLRRQDEDYSEDILMIQPLTQSGAWFQKVDPGASADLADPTLAGLAEELAILEENQHTMSVYSTADMSAMPLAQETSRFLYLTKGRWLDSEDNLEGRRVCVVHNDFAVRRGLSVGDTMTLKLRDLKNPFCGIIVSSYGESYSFVRRAVDVHLGYIGLGEDWNAWQGYETHSEKFEIVGLYGILWDLQPTTISTEMYIPDSCMPAGYCSREQMDLSLYSFVLDSPEYEMAFLAENRQLLEDLGIQVSFVETGWQNFQAACVPLKRSLATNVRVFSAVLIPAMALAAFLYRWQRRKDFAILRSMGVPKVKATWQLVWAMTAIGAVGVTGGGLLAWGYALGKARRTLASLQGPKAASLSADLSPAWLVGLCAAAIAVLFTFTVAGAWAVSRRPVLELLQGTESRAARKGKPVVGTHSGSKDGVDGHSGRECLVSPHTAKVAQEGHIARSMEEIPIAGDPGFALSSRYVLKHIRRAPSKSILTVSVALGFTLALGYLSWSIERNEAKLHELYRVTQVEAEIVKTNPSLVTSSWGGGFIPSEKVDAVLKTGFIKDAYLLGTARASTVGAFAGGEGFARDYKRMVSRIPLLGCSQPERFFFSEREMTGNLKVEYAEGWDESLFSKDFALDGNGGQLPVVLPVAVMSNLQLGLGDGVWLQNSTASASINCKVAGQYTGIGTTSGDGAPILLPFSLLKDFEIDTLHYQIARFVLDPERNRELPEFRAKMDEVFDAADGEIVDVTLIVWDGQMTQVVEPMEKNLLLVRILYSVTLTVSTLIAAGLGALMVLQCAREASIMRVLGVTKRLAHSMLCGEQALLCLLGLVLGLGSYAVLRGGLYAAFAASSLGCAALYLAGCLVGAWQGARSVTNGAPLELLQVKE